MPLNIWFWVIYVGAILLGAWGYYDGQPLWYKRFGGYVVLWILVGILGWHAFGSVVK